MMRTGSGRGEDRIAARAAGPNRFGRLVGRATVVGPLAGLALGAVAANAQEAPSPPTSATEVSGVTVQAKRTPHVSGVVVTADWCPPPDPERYPSGAPPTVVDSYPAPHAVVPPGELVVRLTFDQPMACYWAVTTESRDDDPCTPAGAWTLPRRTEFRLRCRVRPGTGYVIHFGAVQGHDFYGMSGVPAEPFQLAFSTSNAVPTGSFAAALAADPAPGAPPPAGFVACTDRGTQANEAPCRHVAALEDGLIERRR